MKFRTHLAGLTAGLLVAGGLVVASALPASATPPTEECVPAEAWTEVVPDIEHPAVYETVVVTPAVPGTDAIWAVFSPNKDQGPFEGPPTWPTDDRGTWQLKDHLPGGHEGEDGVYQKGNGNGDWFYRQAAVPETPAVTEEKLVTEAYTEIVPDIEHPAVICEEEPVEVDPVICVPSGLWYTESDDVAPTQVEDGLAFVSAGDGKAVGYRQAVGGNLQGWDSLSFSATGDLTQFFFRITVDLSADGGPSYKSLSFPGATTITQSSEAYQFPGKTIADLAEEYPGNVVTSIGWQTNTGAPAGVGATLHSFEGGCGSANFEEPEVVIPEQPEDIVTVDTTEVANCDTETVTVTTKTTTVTHTYDAESNTWVAAEPVVTETSSERPMTEEELADCPVEPTIPPTDPEPTETPTPLPQGGSDDTNDDLQPVALAQTGMELGPWPLTLGALAVALGTMALLFGAYSRRRSQSTED